MLRLRSVLFLTTLPGCLAAPPPAPDPAAGAPIALALVDAQGGRYPSEAAPRDVTLRLAFAGPPPRAPTVRLLRGEAHPPLIAALGGRSRGRALEVPLVLAREAGALALTPTTALAPGARYTLVWGEAEAAVTFSIAVSSSPALGAAVVDTLPADQARGVPRNLARAVVRLDGAIADDDAALAAHLTLRDARGAELPSQLGRGPCEAIDLPPGTCAWRTPDRPLTAGAYRIALAGGLTTLTGATIPAASARFEVGAHDDALAPQLVPERCAEDELTVAGTCVLHEDGRLVVRGRTSEPAAVALSPGACAALTRDHAFVLSGCTPAPAGARTLRLRDLAGHTRDLPLPLPPPPALAAVAIDEVRADPRGKEPAQEYVELLSSSPLPVSLMGFSLSTERSRARTVVGSPTLAPGERALLVAPGFDPADAEDGALPPGLQLVRLDGPLALANEGTTVILRDAAGRRVSAARALAPLLEGQCSARRSAHRDAGGPAHFALDPDGACTPGRATFEPPE